MASYAGSLPGWLTLVTLIIVGYLLVRGGSGQAVSGLQDTNRELVRQVHALQKENSDLRDRVRALEAKTDVAQAIQPVVKAMQDHETRAQQRHEGTLLVLTMIAKRLGPDDLLEEA